MNSEWPWSRSLRWTDAVPGGTAITILADETDRAHAAEGLDVEAINILTAELEIEPWFDGFEARGVLHASVTRICGVSLELFDEMVEEGVLLRFLPYGSPNAPLAPEGDIEFDIEADDPPDCIAGDVIDLGGYLSEQLALALSPFPRKPGAEFRLEATSGPISAFAVLARLKTDLSEDK